MNNEEIKEQLTRWLIDFVEVSNAQLNDWAPCPFARQARVNNTISIKFATLTEFDNVVTESLETLENKEVVVVCFDHKLVNIDFLQSWVKKTNEVLMPLNYVILEDHPDIPEFINGIKMNFGLCGLLVIQKLDKLNNASNTLRNKGYYNVWSSENLDDVVNWRYK